MSFVSFFFWVINKGKKNKYSISLDNILFPLIAFCFKFFRCDLHLSLIQLYVYVIFAMLQKKNLIFTLAQNPGLWLMKGPKALGIISVNSST